MDYSLLSRHQLDQVFNCLSGIPACVRLFAFFLVWIILWVPLAIPLARQLKWHPGRAPVTDSQKLPLVVSLYALVPFIIWGESVLERVPLTTYGLAWDLAALQSLGLGLGLGVLGLAVLFGGQWSLGWIDWLQSPFEQTGSDQPESLAATPAPSIQQNTARLVRILLSTLAVALWISCIEELVFRGFILNQLQRDYPSWLAVTIASLVFALLHLVWAGRETVPQLPGLWLMGVVLSIARHTDQGGLGLAIGLHTGWIWTIASLDTAQLMHYTGKGPVWLTGIGNKPLAGVAGLLFLLVTAGILIGMGA